MGASESVEIQVNFDHSNLLYFGGEEISGSVSCQSTHEKLTFDGISLELVGELGYTTRETKRRFTGNGMTYNEHYTEYHRIPFITLRAPIIEPQYGQSEIKLYRGQYTWPFQLSVPHALPPSSIPSSTEYPYVKYYARLVLNKPWYKPNKRQIYPMIIFPRVDLYQTPSALENVPFSNSNRKKLELSGCLLHRGIVPGGHMSLQIDLKNPKRAEIKRVEVILIQNRHIAHMHHSEIIFRMDLPGLLDFHETDFHRILSLQVPHNLLAPTYSSVSNGHHLPQNINIFYELKLDVKVRGLFTDFSILLPILVGTVSAASDHHEQQQQQSLVNNFMETPLPSAPVFEYDEPPPTYESISTFTKQ